MSDYERIAAAITYIARRAHQQPSLKEVAAHVHLSPFHFQRLFCRWAGISPKRFLQVLTVEHAKDLLGESRTMLEVAGAVGLSGGSRLHDHFVSLEGVTPGEYKARGAGLSIEYAVHGTPFGDAFIALTPRGICRLSFVDRDGFSRCLDDLRAQWPQAVLREDAERTAGIIKNLFEMTDRPRRPLSLYVSGTNFQVSVWNALLRIPPGNVASYTRVAQAIGKPRAWRAVGHAIGANPVAFAIPCHRVIQESGRVGGYRWGETRKHTILVWESARSENAP